MRPDTNGTGIILIKEGTLLPASLAVETETFLPGWRVVKNLDRSALIRSIEDANWHFFYLAGDIRSTSLGSDRPGTLRRAAKRALAKQQEQNCNSLEISSVAAKHFLGIPYISVIARTRHIQQDLCLVPVKTFAFKISAVANGELPGMQYKPLPSST